MFIKSILKPGEVRTALEELMLYILGYRFTEREIEGYCRKIYTRAAELEIDIMRDVIVLRLEIRNVENGAYFFLAIWEPQSKKFFPIDKIEGFFKGDEDVGKRSSGMVAGVLKIPDSEVETKPLPRGWNRPDSAVHSTQTGYAYDPKRLPEFGPARRAKRPVGLRAANRDRSSARGHEQTQHNESGTAGGKSDRSDDPQQSIFR